MSLLTERQIADILDILNVCGTTTQARDLEQWNEKQQPAQPLAQFKPDWSKYPKNAEYLALKEVWYDQSKNEIGFEIKLAYEKPITQHPHAVLIAKYAEVAARRVDPWVEFEFRVDERGWETPTTDISFYPDFEYRHIGETK